LIRKVAARSAAKKRPHAIRKPKDVTFEKPGDVVQIDTLSIHPLPSVTIKHFTAYDPFAKWTVARPCKQATAKNAAQFLEQVLKQMPDPVKAIQIDGGSEFMAEFEQACADKMLPLYLLPPRSPKLNGAVERCNGAWRYEFYACIDLPLSIDKITPVGRRLPAPLQSPQTSRSPGRKNPSPIPLYPPSQRKTPVSYLLSQDTSLTKCISSSRLWPAKIRPPSKVQ
jgi:transposase InsO family protein